MEKGYSEKKVKEMLNTFSDAYEQTPFGMNGVEKNWLPNFKENGDSELAKLIYKIYSDLYCGAQSRTFGVGKLEQETILGELRKLNICSPTA